MVKETRKSKMDEEERKAAQRWWRDVNSKTYTPDENIENGVGYNFLWADLNKEDIKKGVYGKMIPNIYTRYSETLLLVPCICKLCGYRKEMLYYIGNKTYRGIMAESGKSIGHCPLCGKLMDWERDESKASFLGGKDD